MWELNHKEDWAPKNWCLLIVVLEKTLESPLDCKQIKSVNPKGNQPSIFIGRTDAEVRAPILWSPDIKSQLTEKDPDAGKDWGQEEKGMTEDEMVGRHHWLNGQEFEQTQEREWRTGKPGVHGVAKSHTWLSEQQEIMAENFPALQRQASSNYAHGSIETHIHAYSIDVEEYQDKDRTVKEEETDYPQATDTQQKCFCV